MKEDILATCEMIMQLAVPLALRLSAILMSGVILCFHHKQNFFLEDCHDAVRSAKNFAKQGEAKEKGKSSNQLRSARTKSERTVTCLGDSVNEVSKHVEEIFLQVSVLGESNTSTIASATFVSGLIVVLRCRNS